MRLSDDKEKIEDGRGRRKFWHMPRHAVGSSDRCDRVPGSCLDKNSDAMKKLMRRSPMPMSSARKYGCPCILTILLVSLVFYVRHRRLRGTAKK
mmetsp:Transcript_59231/g.80922  ORF Transcript_59231/g.80922 Transcript_59231/m.80922 type:complete len:94 (-) Transcript_59231:153-434(-)